MPSKLISLAEAISKYVKDGDTVYAAGIDTSNSFCSRTRDYPARFARPGSCARHRI